MEIYLIKVDESAMEKFGIEIKHKIKIRVKIKPLKALSLSNLN